MKIDVRAELKLRINKRITAESLEDGLAKARRFGLDDFVYEKPDCASWPDTIEVKIIGAVEHKGK